MTQKGKKKVGNDGFDASKVDLLSIQTDYIIFTTFGVSWHKFSVKFELVQK